MLKRDVDDWFVRQILPLEGRLNRFLQCRLPMGEEEATDIRQETYARVYESVLRNGRPLHAQSFVLTVAKNILIDRARRQRVVSMEYVADIEAVETWPDLDMVNRGVIARMELARFDKALRRLPDRCAEVVRLRKIEQLSQREVAGRMGITEATVERQLSKGIRLLAQEILAEEPLQEPINGRKPWARRS
ncbi:ECF RNA polymerase sigma factor SigE [compost metagenome]